MIYAATFGGLGGIQDRFDLIIPRARIANISRV
jgi:hypothetical protein